MADISIAGMTRPKSVLTNALTMPLVVSLTNNDGTDTSEVWIRRENTAPNPTTFTVAADFSSGATTITADVSGGFSNVRVGDEVAGTGIAVGSVVTAKASNDSITVNLATTGVGSARSLTFTPPTYDASLMAIQIVLTGGGGSLKATVKGYSFNGLNSADTDDDGTDNVTIAGGTEVFNQSITIDTNAFLNNARVAATA